MPAPLARISEELSSVVPLPVADLAPVASPGFDLVEAGRSEEPFVGPGRLVRVRAAHRLESGVSRPFAFSLDLAKEKGDKKKNLVGAAA